MLARRFLQFSRVIVFVMAASHLAAAVCPTNSSTEEQLLWSQHNCDAAFINWFRDSYNLKSEHWGGGWGWNECNPDFAFPKMVNAGFLLANGLQDEVLGPWHSSSDYSKWANAHGDDFHYKPVDSNDAYAASYGGWWQTDRVEMMCPGINTFAAERASTMLHEATHIVYWQYDHKANNPGSNCGNTPCSDDWLFHTLGEYAYGDLRGHKHSMMQIEVEFLCDLGEFPDPWVPASIAQSARLLSTSLMNNRIVNPPGWTCGTPRPLAPPPPPCPIGQKCCEEATPPQTGCALCVPSAASCP